MSEKLVPTELGVRATASLQEQVRRELEEKDPEDKERAKASLGIKDEV